MNLLQRPYALLVQIAQLPVAQLEFHKHINPQNIEPAFRYFTKRHPKYKIIRNKTLGAALIDLGRFDSGEQYVDSIKAKNLGGHHARRAKARGYRFVEIDRNAYIDDIHAINTSVDSRQGRPMDAQYLEKKQCFDAIANFRYYGVLDNEGQLRAYCNYGHYGNFGAFSQLMGYRNNDGVMHLMIVEIICRLIDERRVSYVMYDTFFGAQPGLQQFKKILGFAPYRAKYTLQ
ncbi:MAG: hypothetical protein V4857_10790 [Pseudomonadota bacterium]